MALVVEETFDRKEALLYAGRRTPTGVAGFTCTHLGDATAHGTGDVVRLAARRAVETGNAVVDAAHDTVDAFLADGVGTEEKARLFEQVEAHGAYQVLRRPEIFVQVDLLQVDVCIHISDTWRSYVTQRQW